MRDQEEKAIYLVPVLKDAISSRKKAEKERKKEINMKFFQECNEHRGCLCLAAPGHLQPWLRLCGYVFDLSWSAD